MVLIAVDIDEFIIGAEVEGCIDELVVSLVGLMSTEMIAMGELAALSTLFTAKLTFDCSERPMLLTR